MTTLTQYNFLFVTRKQLNSRYERSLSILLFSTEIFLKKCPTIYRNIYFATFSYYKIRNYISEVNENRRPHSFYSFWVCSVVYIMQCNNCLYLSPTLIVIYVVYKILQKYAIDINSLQYDAFRKYTTFLQIFNNY